MQIQGTIAVVSGASYGVGAATARALGRAGARVVLLARTAAALQAVAADIRAAGGVAHVYPCDLADPAAVARLGPTILAEVGVPDLLVHSAGAGRWQAIEETSPAEMLQQTKVPYFATFYLTRALIEPMLARRRGRIVVVNSPVSIVAWPGCVGYAAARWALRGFTEALRADLARTGVGVTSIIPGKISSNYFAANPGAEERIPLVGRLLPTITPEQAAATIVRAIERDAREVLTPRMVGVFALVHRLVPWLIPWLAVQTGWRRPTRPIS